LRAFDAVTSFVQQSDSGAVPRATKAIPPILSGSEDGMAEARLVVVTGAAGGIGSAVCRRLVEDGYRVAALDLNEKGLSELQGRVGTQLTPFKVDQTRESEVKDVVAKIESEVGPIDALANVTGWSGSTRFDQETSDYWHKVIGINYLSLLYVAHPILTRMIGRKHGRMVFVASDAGRVGTGGEAVYAGAKGAVIAFAKSIARENARHNITVNCIAPGPTETPLYLHEAAAHPEFIERMLKAIPMRRPAKPAEQAAAISFLLSADAEYITGQTLSVSGGLTMV
jgi:2-hydroxycyclohexanecarboxyl-CoA dehydrogenase